MSIELEMNHFFPLDEGGIFRIEEGAVNLFATKVRRHFLAHFEAGDVIYGLNHKIFSIQAEKKTVLVPLEKEMGVEKWIATLTESLPRAERTNLPKDLETFNAAFAKRTDANLSSRENETTLRIEKKKKDEEKLLSDIELNMVKLLEPGEFHPPKVKATDFLFQAFGIVANEMGAEAIAPKDEVPSEEIADHLEAFCKASGMRKRRVTLTNHFQKEASTPFLAFTKEDLKPVALIQKRVGVYEMVDPDTKKTQIIESVDHLDQTVYAFYESLPENVYKGKDLFKHFLKKNGKEFFPLLTYGIIGSLISLATPLGIYLFFSKAIPNANIPLTLQIVIGLLFVAVSSTAFFLFQSFVIGRLEGFSANEIDLGLWDRIIKLPVDFFKRYSSGDLSSRIFSTESIRNIFTMQTVKSVLSTLFSLSNLFMMAVFSLELTIVSLVIVLGAYIFVRIACKQLSKLERKIADTYSHLNAFIIQIIRGVAKLRLAKAENYAFGVWARMFIKSKRLEIEATNWRNTIFNINSTLPFIAYGAVFCDVFLLQRAGKISIASFLGFNSAFLSFIYGFITLSRALAEIAKAGPQWERTYPFFETPPEITKERIPTPELSGDIHLDEVFFRYGEEAPYILDNISLHVKQGESIAIAGPSGSGKSTIVRLLLGFELPENGAVYFDNRDLQHLDPHDVRRNIGVVMQSEGMIAGTIYENLVRGALYTKEQIERAVALSCFDQDLSQFPMGLHTYIPMNGETLSGGQKQRLLLARALLPEPSVLIFDEATSALDNHTQNIITKNVDALKITRIIIAHRLSTIKSVDRIYVLDKGKIIQEGSYDKLAKEEGLFGTMLKRQKLV